MESYLSSIFALNIFFFERCIHNLQNIIEFYVLFNGLLLILAVIRGLRYKTRGLKSYCYLYV